MWCVLLVGALGGCAQPEGPPAKWPKTVQECFAAGEGWTQVEALESKIIVTGTGRTSPRPHGVRTPWGVDFVQPDGSFFCYTAFGSRLNFPIALSPDGTRLAAFQLPSDERGLNQFRALDVLDLKTGQVALSHRFPEGASPGGVYGLETEARWNPDASAITFYAQRFPRPGGKAWERPHAIVRLVLKDNRTEIAYDADQEQILDFDLTRDGRTLALIQWNSNKSRDEPQYVALYDLVTKERRTVPLPGGSRAAFNLEWHPDGKRLAVTDTRVLWFGPPDDLREIYRRPKEAYFLSSLSFDPAGKRLLIEDTRGPLLFDLESGKPERILKATVSKCMSQGFSWSRDGRFLAGYVSRGAAFPRKWPVGDAPPPSAPGEVRKYLFVADLERREVIIYPEYAEGLSKHYNTQIIDDPDVIRAMKQWMPNFVHHMAVSRAVEGLRIAGDYVSEGDLPQLFRGGAGREYTRWKDQLTLDADRARFEITFRVEFQKKRREPIEGSISHELSREEGAWGVRRTTVRFKDVAEPLDVSERVRKRDPMVLEQLYDEARGRRP